MTFESEINLPLTQARLMYLLENSTDASNNQMLVQRFSTELALGHRDEIEDAIEGLNVYELSVAAVEIIHKALDFPNPVEINRELRYVEAWAIPVALSQAPGEFLTHQEPAISSQHLATLLKTDGAELYFKPTLIAVQRLPMLDSKDWLAHLREVATGHLTDVYQLKTNPSQENIQPGRNLVLKPRVIMVYKVTRTRDSAWAERFNIDDLSKAVSADMAASGISMQAICIDGLIPAQKANSQLMTFVSSARLRQAVELAQEGSTKTLIGVVCIKDEDTIEVELRYEGSRQPIVSVPLFSEGWDITEVIDKATDVLLEYKVGFTSEDWTDKSAQLHPEQPRRIYTDNTDKGKRRAYRQFKSELPKSLRNHTLIQFVEHLSDRPEPIRKNLMVTFIVDGQHSSFGSDNWFDMPLWAAQLVANGGGQHAGIIIRRFETQRHAQTGHPYKTIAGLFLLKDAYRFSSEEETRTAMRTDANGEPIANGENDLIFGSVSEILPKLHLRGTQF